MIRAMCYLRTSPMTICTHDIVIETGEMNRNHVSNNIWAKFLVVVVGGLCA